MTATNQHNARSGNRPALSKSRFIAGTQCELRLWNDIYRRDLASEFSDSQLAIFDRGTAIGELARRRYPGGTLVGFKPWERQAAVAETWKLMADPAVPAIYEAALTYQGVFVRVDVLARNGQGWDLVEVKAATRPEKEVFQQDVAVQHWVARGTGLAIHRAGVLVLDRDYIYPGGDYDLDRLFTFFDSTERSLDSIEWVEQNVQRFHQVLAEDQAPEIGVGKHCFSPYECPYYASCSHGLELPEHPLDHLNRLHHGRRAQLEALGIDNIADIPDDFALTEIQQRIRRAVVSGQAWKSAELKRELQNVTWPLYYLDFEAFQPALPLYPGTRPFQAVPFQYSLHIENESGEVTHREYLHTENSDPRPALAKALLEDIGDTGSIVVYSGYERRMLNEMARFQPELAPKLQAATERLWDLLPVIRNHYYHPDFNGSFSIKAVLPALVPGAHYSELAIADGMAAATAYEGALHDSDQQRRNAVFGQLIDYCKLDTLAMVHLREALREISENNNAEQQ
ncbi:MAG: DUF2779 domain-containing protein [Wenzhouxiangellaceae bacterium]|nr:DUF2779 domain-containing protein [Wenzhouxiangellaceae bacterium]